VILQRAGEIVAGELTALVGIEELGPVVSGERFLERLDTKIGAERVRQLPRQHRAADPVHDDHQIEKALGHRDIRNVRASHLIDPIDRDPAEQVRLDLVLRCRLAGVGALVDRHQPH
jgi:hypothetical protein